MYESVGANPIYYLTYLCTTNEERKTCKRYNVTNEVREWLRMIWERVVKSGESQAAVWASPSV